MNTEVASMYDEMSDEQETIAPTNDEIKSVALLVEKQCKLEDRVEQLEAELKAAKKDLQKCSWEQLPEAMFALKCNSFTLNNGAIVSVKEDLRTTISVANKPWCFDWLRENGHGDIIRDEIKTKFGVGEGDKAKALGTFLDDNEQPFTQTQAVHPQTLKAFVGVELDQREPDDEWKTKFGVFQQRIAKIQRPE
jgi:hypothetical protein